MAQLAYTCHTGNSAWANIWPIFAKSAQDNPRIVPIQTLPITCTFLSGIFVVWIPYMKLFLLLHRTPCKQPDNYEHTFVAVRPCHVFMQLIYIHSCRHLGRVDTLHEAVPEASTNQLSSIAHPKGERRQIIHCHVIDNIVQELLLG